MSAFALPSALARPARVDDEVACKVALDLTLYVAGPSEAELDWLLRFYAELCPSDRLSKYTITELNYWADVDRPVLTDSGRRAAELGDPQAALEPVRRRLRGDRAFEVGYWDGREIDDPEGSWSMRCHRIKLRSSGLHGFVRLMMPVDIDGALVARAATSLASNLRFFSGHGGLVFAQDPWLSEDAFDQVYALARRFWGVDIDDMNDTLPLMTSAIKGVSWLTLVGSELLSDALLTEVGAALADRPAVKVFKAQQGLVIAAGDHPNVLDQHRPDATQMAYREVAHALADWFLSDHVDFPGERFITNGNTVGWLRRFLEPGGWR